MQEKPDFPLGRMGGYVVNWVAVVFIVVTSAVGWMLVDVDFTIESGVLLMGDCSSSCCRIPLL